MGSASSSSDGSQINTGCCDDTSVQSAHVLPTWNRCGQSMKRETRRSPACGKAGLPGTARHDGRVTYIVTDTPAVSVIGVVPVMGVVSPMVGSSVTVGSAMMVGVGSDVFVGSWVGSSVGSDVLVGSCVGSSVGSGVLVACCVSTSVGSGVFVGNAVAAGTGVLVDVAPGCSCNLCHQNSTDARPVLSKYSTLS